MLAMETTYRDFLNARLRDTLLQVGPVVTTLCVAFMALGLATRPAESRWTIAAISLASALLMASYWVALKRRSDRVLIEWGGPLVAVWLLVDATWSMVLGSRASDMVYLGVIMLAAGAIFVHPAQMAWLMALSAAGGILGWVMSPQDALWGEMSLASLVAGCMGVVAFRARRRAFQAAFEQGRKKLEAGLQYQRAAEGSDSALWEYEPASETLTLASRWAEMFGYEPGSLSPRLEEWTNRIHLDDRKSVLKALQRQFAEPEPPRLSVEHRIRCADGSYRWTLVTAKASPDASGAIRIAGSFSDIDQRVALERQLRHEALHDRLTDLANRRLLLERLDQLTALIERHPSRRFAVAFYDLDGFKRINDLWGHAAGDQVLIEIARRLKTTHRAEDLVARLGGDEFVAILEEAINRTAAESAAERTRRALEEPIELDGRTAWVSVSCGVAWSGDGYRSGTALLEAADLAMYGIKRGKRKRKGRDYEAATEADSSATISAAEARARSSSPGG